MNAGRTFTRVMTITLEKTANRSYLKPQKQKTKKTKKKQKTKKTKKNKKPKRQKKQQKQQKTKKQDKQMLYSRLIYYFLCNKKYYNFL